MTLKRKINKLKNKSIKLGNKITEYEEIVNQNKLEVDNLKHQLNRFSNNALESKKDKDEILRGKNQIREYKILLEKREKEIEGLKLREKRIKDSMEKVSKQFHEMIRSAKNLQGEIRVKEHLVKKLQSNLR